MSAAVAGDSTAVYEVAPDLSPGEALPASMVAGTNFKIVDSVQIDGLMHRHVIDSKFGRFTVYGLFALKIRNHEIAALTEISKTSTVEVAVEGGGRGVGTQVQAAQGSAPFCK